MRPSTPPSDVHTPPDPPPDRPRRRPLWLQLLLFVLSFGALFAAWKQAAGTAWEKVLIADLTVAPAAFWIRQLTPEVAAVAQGFSIRAPGGGINVLNGCEGLDVLLMLWAALVAVPMGWRRRLVGWVAGSMLAWGLNQARVVALFYANRADKDLFALLHGTVAPLLLILCLALAFALLLQWRPRGAAPDPVA